LLAVAAAGAAEGLYAHVAAGHAAAEGNAVGVQVIGQWAHIVAAAVWLGGLAALVVAVKGEPREEKSRAAKRFSAAAVGALALVLVTGVVRSIDEVGSWRALIDTGYGRLVLVKILLILVLAGLGAVNRYRNVPRLRSGAEPLRRVGRIELILAVVAIVAAGGLASLIPPATVPAAAGRPAAIELDGSDFATSVRASLQIDPGVPGPNRFALRLRDYDSGEALEDADVTLRFQPLGRPEIGETSIPLEPGDEPGLFAASGPNLSTSGPWDVVAVIQRGADAVEVPFELATVCPTQTVEGQGDEPTIHLFEAPAGGTTEGYVIRLGPGRLEAHFTFIAGNGGEERLADITMTAWRSGEGVRSLEPLLLSEGHFFADTRLTPGEWRFDASVTTAGGAPATGCFEETVGG
jgi:copper transport protein